MSRNRKIGHQGEDIAFAFLRDLGYEMLERNWTSGHKEIDIICKKEDMFFFVEVKTRTSLRQGQPEESISEKKIKAVTEAARIYLYDKIYRDIRFDVIAIYLKQENEHELTHITDAFY